MKKWSWPNYKVILRIGYVYTTELLQDKTTKEYLWYSRSPRGIVYDIISQRFPSRKEATGARENYELKWTRMHEIGAGPL